MRSVATVNPKRTAKKRKAGGGQEKRILKSKLNDPLNQPDKYLEAEGGDSEEEVFDGPQEATSLVREEPQKRIFSSREASNLGSSSAGRREWQAKHKKGKFNTMQAKKKAHLTPGTFNKNVKNYK